MLGRSANCASISSTHAPINAHAQKCIGARTCRHAHTCTETNAGIHINHRHRHAYASTYVEAHVKVRTHIQARKRTRMRGRRRRTQTHSTHTKIHAHTKSIIAAEHSLINGQFVSLQLPFTVRHRSNRQAVSLAPQIEMFHAYKGKSVLSYRSISFFFFMHLCYSIKMEKKFFPSILFLKVSSFQQIKMFPILSSLSSQYR